MSDLTREGWLIGAVEALRPLFKDAGHEVPEFRVSCGFPGGKNPLKTIGQCWAPVVSKDGVAQMFVSPILDDIVGVLAVLVHEITHAVVGVEHEHKRPFSKVAKAVGLEGPWKATVASDELVQRLDAIGANLGHYPNSAMDPSTLAKPQTTRMLKLVADECCGYTVRTTKKWIELGLPSCPCGNEMELW